MRNPLLDTNFSLFNILNTIAYGVVIFSLVITNVRCMKHEKNPCKVSIAMRFAVALAFALLIISAWISLPC